MRLTQQQINDFNEKGYLIVPNVLTSDEVDQLRSRILEIFSTDEWKKSPFNTSQVLASVYDVFPEFISISLKPEVIEILSDLCGTKPVLIPETSIHYKYYTGWHKDTTSMAKKGWTFHLENDCLLLQCGFYLQDNSPQYGGGLTVMEGSHKTSDNFLNGPTEHGIIDKLKYKTGLYSEEKDKNLNPNRHKIIDIPSKIGDFVIFNMKTNHRATNPANGNPASVPFESSKIALFNAFSKNNDFANEYFDYICSRPEAFYQELKKREIPKELKEHAEELNFLVL